MKVWRNCAFIIKGRGDRKGDPVFPQYPDKWQVALPVEIEIKKRNAVVPCFEKFLRLLNVCGMVHGLKPVRPHHVFQIQMDQKIRFNNQALVAFANHGKNPYADVIATPVGLGTKDFPRRCRTMKPNVLIVEDNFLLCADIADLVADRLNATPVTADSIAKAMKLVCDDIAFAFLDIDVSDGESYPVAQKLMDNEIPIVFVSGKDQDLLPDEFSDVPFVSKPASPRVLVQLAKSLSSAFG